jgi:hypothetical protein
MFHFVSLSTEDIVSSDFKWGIAFEDAEGVFDDFRGYETFGNIPRNTLAKD